MRTPASTSALALFLALFLGSGLSACSDEDAASPLPDPRTTASAPPTASPLPELPEPRTEVSGVGIVDRIVVAGGLKPDGRASRRADLFVVGSARWEPLPPLPTARHHAASVFVEGRVYLLGGYTNDSTGRWQELDSVISFELGEKEWRHEPSLRSPRGAPAAGGTSGVIVVFGGVSRGQVVRTSEVWKPGESAWRRGPDLQVGREHAAGTGAGGRVYAIAGRVGSLESNLRSVESIDPLDLTPGWRREPDLNDPRGGTAAADVNGVPCVAGGEAPTGTISSVECLREGRWVRSGSLRTPRHGLAVVHVSERLHVVGGGPQPGLFVSGAHEALDL